MSLFLAPIESEPLDQTYTPPKQIQITDEDLESPGKDDSVETVIPKEKAINPKYLVPTPNHLKPVEEMKRCLTCFLDSTIIEEVEPPSGIFTLDMTDHCQNVKELSQNNYQELQEFAKAQSLEFSGQYQAFDNDINDDFAAMAMEQGGIEFEGFGAPNDNFEAQLQNDEKELEDEQRFVIPDEMEGIIQQSFENIRNNSKTISADFIETSNMLDVSVKTSNKSEESTKTPESESMTEYFNQGTSKLGHSLSSSNSGGSRPNFGNSPFDSPEIRAPVTLLDEEIVKETLALSMSKKHDLTRQQEEEISNIAKVRIILNILLFFNQILES